MQRVHPRVVSLLPSATEIVGHLGLKEFLVGVSHECDLLPDQKSMSDMLANNTCRRVTTSEIDPHIMSQEDIHTKVLGFLRKGDSIYHIIENELNVANPTVILTQSLCDVCAPSTAQVQSAYKLPQTCSLNSNDLFKEEVLPLATASKTPLIINLQPSTLNDVADTFSVISNAIADSTDLGEELKIKFQENLTRISNCTKSLSSESSRPSCVMLEWTDPLFDGGHWIPDMMDIANVTPFIFNVFF